jgi:hypothetical protein
MGVLGDITWRKWHGVLTDEDPLCSPSYVLILRTEINAHYKAKPKCWRYAMVSTGLPPALALWGLQRVRRSSTERWGKRTHPSEWGRYHG